MEITQLYKILTLKPPAPIIFVFFYIIYCHITHQLLDMLKIKRDTNQQDLQIVDLQFDKYQYFSLT